MSYLPEFEHKLFTYLHSLVSLNKLRINFALQILFTYEIMCRIGSILLLQVNWGQIVTDLLFPFKTSHAKLNVSQWNV